MKANEYSSQSFRGADELLRIFDPKNALNRRSVKTHGPFFLLDSGPYKTASFAASPLLRPRRVNQKSAKVYYIKCQS